MTLSMHDSCTLSYSDQAHFTRAFRRWTAVSPSCCPTQLRSTDTAAQTEV